MIFDDIFRLRYIQAVVIITNKLNIIRYRDQRRYNLFWDYIRNKLSFSQDPRQELNDDFPK